MKRIIILFMIFLFTSCSANNDYENNLSEESTDHLISEITENGDEIIAEEQHYRMKRSNGAYFYEILDSAGNVVRKDGSYTKEPHISMLNDTTVKVSYQAGTGLSTRWTFYYDTVNGEFSPEYYSVFGESDGKVIYRSDNSIIVSDIFGKTKHYVEISKYKYPISETAEPFVSAEFDESGSMIIITYLTGDNFEKVTECFDIGENGWKGAYKAAFETFRCSVDYTEDSMFSLRDINGDDVPELFISEGTYHTSNCQIYSYHNGLIGLGEYGTYGDILFKPNLKLLTAGDLNQGYDYFFEYSLSDDFVIVLEKRFYNNAGAAESPDKTEYMIDGKSVSAEAYQAEIKKYHDDDSISLGYHYSFTESDISSALSKYK